MKKYILLIAAGYFISACNSKEIKPDATGTFEADEVVVSSELAGRVINFNVKEGARLTKDSSVGYLDAEGIVLQKEQVIASMQALNQKTMDVSPQITLLQEQLAVQDLRLKNLQHEKQRIDNLVKADAATKKQLDDITSQVEVAAREMAVIRQQISVQKNNVSTQNRTVLSETAPLQKRIEQLDDQLKRARILNPVTGTVLTKYAEAGEIVSAGKALYKIADLSSLNLRAYITGTQLPQIKLNQQVTVLIDDSNKKYREYPGIITWISDKAEFTPKTIQTREERANLVYAVKIAVKNDGYLKIGMYGEVLLAR